MNKTNVVGAAFCAALVALSSSAAAQTVSSFTVVNADTGADIATFNRSGTVSVAATPRINVRANASAAKSVVFTDGGSRRTENAAPYAYKGDSGGVYAKWLPAAGTYTLNAQPFSGSGGSGTAGPTATLALTIVTTPLGGTTPSADAGPDQSLPLGSGKLMIDPQSVHHFVYDRDRDGDGQRDPAYLAGVGGPEGFLYLSTARKQFIIDKLLNTAAVNATVNGLYFHSTRAFGGDGSSSESPFIVATDARSGIDMTRLASWYVDLKRLDDAGVTLWFTLFDDHAVPYGCRFNDDYKAYATTIVNHFNALKHLVWVTQEEYRWTSGSQSACSLADNDARQIGLAAAIRAADAVHPIATHHMGGQAMQFGSDANIRVFGQQTTSSSPAAMHDNAGKQGWGNWVYVMAEAHPWHKEHIAAGDRSALRRSNWATALSGGYVMVYDSFESNDPTDAMLDDLRRLKVFMEATAFNRMAPLFDTALSNARLDNTKYLLSNPSQGLYILYGEFDAGKMGVRGAPAGRYALRWFDPISGQTVDQTFAVGSDGLASFTKPASFGLEVALYLRRQ